MRYYAGSHGQRATGAVFSAKSATQVGAAMGRTIGADAEPTMEEAIHAAGLTRRATSYGQHEICDAHGNAITTLAPKYVFPWLRMQTLRAELCTRIVRVALDRTFTGAAQ